MHEYVLTQSRTQQYLGFGMPADTWEGRRAAQASAASMENDQAERDASLKKVEARDLVEFGMIPVRLSVPLSTTSQQRTQIIEISFLLSLQIESHRNLLDAFPS